MIVYFDTSALLKRYVAEADSDAVAVLWNQATILAASQILYAEAASAFARKRRERPAEAAALNDAERTFRKDWTGMYRIGVDDDINRRVDELLSRHVLRGADAIHLASAVMLREVSGAEVVFACADAGLRAAARGEGLAAEP